MKKYTFPLTKKMAFAPVALIMDNPLDSRPNRPGTFIFRDGKSCDVQIHLAFTMDADTDRIDTNLTIEDHGAAIVTDGAHTFQIAYKQTSPKA